MRKTHMWVINTWSLVVRTGELYIKLIYNLYTDKRTPEYPKV